MTLRPPTGPGTLHAWLGPTNTGKTHRAVERMLTFDSGMIGLPLRLLAREVYDRVTARIGEAQVALVTGEERRGPRDARWFICTVEAMPVERPVDCVVIDEIQLAADRARGHVFTDRLLHLRGRRETILCGAATMAPLLRRLLPAAELDTFPRLSRLTHLGHRRIGQLPPRSALVAFSADEVYALAERVRRKHGGAAVVLGALSPRARNAQAALFQSGEVPYLVATDAIGMGLNLDITHVGFSRTVKFDGVEVRRLKPAELAQIAGRAGRHVQDGTFGAVEDEPELAAHLAAAIESHDFPPVRGLYWRSSALDLVSLPGLLRSLRAPPPDPLLQRTVPDEDELVLDVLSRHPDVRARATDEPSVRLLWDVCRIPDYRKQPGDAHPELLRRVYTRLVDAGRLDAGWVLRQVDRLERVDGDVDELLQRLAYVRTWTYVSHHAGWVEDAAGVAERARGVEDLLSDALHTRLTERFVDRRAGVHVASTVAVEGDAIRVGGRRVGELRGLSWLPDDPKEREPPRVVVAEVAARLEERVRRVVDADHTAFTITGSDLVTWEGAPVGRLVPGPRLHEPGVRVARNGLLTPAMTTRLGRRLEAWLRDELARIFAPLRAVDVPRGPARGVLYALEEGSGCGRRSASRSPGTNAERSRRQACASAWSGRTRRRCSRTPGTAGGSGPSRPGTRSRRCRRRRWCRGSRGRSRWAGCSSDRWWCAWTPTRRSRRRCGRPRAAGRSPRRSCWSGSGTRGRRRWPRGASSTAPPDGCGAGDGDRGDDLARRAS